MCCWLQGLGFGMTEPSTIANRGWLPVQKSHGRAYEKGTLVITAYKLKGGHQFVLWLKEGGRLGQFDTAEAAADFAETLK